MAVSQEWPTAMRERPDVLEVGCCGSSSSWRLEVELCASSLCWKPVVHQAMAARTKCCDDGGVDNKFGWPN
jgi:hypothetical protein